MFPIMAIICKYAFRGVCSSVEAQACVQPRIIIMTDQIFSYYAAVCVLFKSQQKGLNCCCYSCSVFLYEILCQTFF